MDKITAVRGGDPAQGTAATEVVTNTLDTSMLNKTSGYKGEMTKGVYKYTFGRPDI